MSGTENQQCDECGSDSRTRLLKRATEAAGWPDAWRTKQVHECRECGTRWLV